MTAQIIPLALYQEVAERLRQRIYSQDLKSGEWIDELAQCQHYGISRTPLREALKVLHAEGLVVLVPRRGCRVNTLTAAELDQVFPVMALLEGRCAYEAYTKLTPESLARLQELHAELEHHAATGDIDHYYERNSAFHEEVERLADNQWLQRAVADLRKVLKLARHRQLLLPGRLQASLNEHRRIIEAFRGNDPAVAEAVMKDHVLKLRAALTRLDNQE
jgi:DNA-binding GntR family transcriptional regulator